MGETVFEADEAEVREVIEHSEPELCLGLCLTATRLPVVPGGLPSGCGPVDC
ncbi:hypothetical protein GCM10010211_85680 [Streptomyces albospinus]|uniref:Uncharacterized protein n=1 Tax=Streptomyces albospinus TaxID=285515 RepID=A0ABQ2VRC8_9ACTN|nr:hypothetical protein [Streptomyces albospinus]GGV05732.1 hypothetical protein GCM10010211_85680 [Streptomyces albospinus]